jgi:hypothetical protein
MQKQRASVLAMNYMDALDRDDFGWIHPKS